MSHGPAVVVRLECHGVTVKVAHGTGACLFGARYGLPPTSTLGQIDQERQRIALVAAEMGGGSA